MKKIALITFIIGIILIICAIVFNNIDLSDNNSSNNNSSPNPKPDSNENISDIEKLEYLEMSNIKILSDNSFSFDIYNKSDEDINKQNINLCALNNDNKIIMIAEFYIENLKSKESGNFQYNQSDIFNENPTTLFATVYNPNNLIENKAIGNQLADILRKEAKLIVEKTYGKSNKDLNITITALELENKYHVDLGELKNSKYKCNLETSIVEVSFDKNINEYQYVTTIDCEAFYEE